MKWTKHHRYSIYVVLPRSTQCTYPQNLSRKITLKPQVLTASINSKDERYKNCNQSLADYCITGSVILQHRIWDSGVGSDAVLCQDDLAELLQTYVHICTRVPTSMLTNHRVENDHTIGLSDYAAAHWYSDKLGLEVCWGMRSVVCSVSGVVDIMRFSDLFTQDMELWASTHAK